MHSVTVNIDFRDMDKNVPFIKQKALGERNFEMYLGGILYLWMII
jgi:hypothetical protein